MLYLEGQLEEHEAKALEAHMALCAACRRELEDSRRVWELMGDLEVPEPSADVRTRFDAMLDTYKASAETRRGSGFAKWLVQPFGLRSGYALAFGLFLLLVGAGIGFLVRRPAAASDTESQLGALNARVSEMQEMVMKSLLENPSASERLRGVSYTSEIRTAN